jgi:hypothetical protein
MGEEPENRRLVESDTVVTDTRANALSVVDVFETIHKGIQQEIACNGESPFAETYEYSPSVNGARLALATFYQSCTALTQVLDVNSPKLKGVDRDPSQEFAGSKKRRIKNKEQFIDSHIVLSQIKANKEFPNRNCKNTLESLPVYGYGSKPSTGSMEVESLDLKSGERSSEKGFEIDFFGRGNGVSSRSKEAHSIDCSGFIASALASQGLKLRKGSSAKDDRTFGHIGTITFEENAGKEDSCLERVSFRGKNTIKPGDILNVSRSHIVMIDTLGVNPLGIEGRNSKEECLDIGVDNFNFTYIHSGAIRNSYGPSRVHSSNHIGTPGTMFNQLVELAQKTCIANLNDGGAISSHNFAGKTGGGNSKYFSVLRHDSKNSECVEEKKTKIVGQECVASCFPGEAAI